MVSHLRIIIMCTTWTDLNNTYPMLIYLEVSRVVHCYILIFVEIIIYQVYWIIQTPSDTFQYCLLDVTFLLMDIFFIRLDFQGSEVSSKSSVEC